MKIIGIIGEPAAGKSTVMRNFLATLTTKNPEVVKDGLVVYTTYQDDKVLIAGKYEEGVTFCGTDVTSKACGPKFRDWLIAKQNDPKYDDWSFYFEGERFSNSKFFDFFFNSYEGPVSIHCLDASEEILNERNINRSNQNEGWRKGMRTRINNLKSKYPVNVEAQGFELA